MFDKFVKDTRYMEFINKIKIINKALEPINGIILMESINKNVDLKMCNLASDLFDAKKVYLNYIIIELKTFITYMYPFKIIKINQCTVELVYRDKTYSFKMDFTVDENLHKIDELAKELLTDILK